MEHTFVPRRIAALLLPLALVLLTGCPPRGKGPAAQPTPAPLSIKEAVAAVNGNVAGITRVLSSGGIGISAVMHDEGEAHRYDLSGTLRFLPPHYLYLDLGHSLEPSAMRLGSNDKLFWVWVKPQRGGLWYGWWTDLDPRETYRMPLSPDMILAAMGLSRLPGTAEGLRGPVPQIDDGQYYKVLYMASSGGAPWIQREYWLDRLPPYLPRVVRFRFPDGREQMHSTLNGYERVGDSNVHIAREIHMSWPDTGDSLSMRLGRVTFNDRIKPDSPAFRLDMNKTPVSRNHWARVTKERQSMIPAMQTQPAVSETIEPAASESSVAPGGTEPAAAAGPTAAEPAPSEPAQNTAPMELESSPE